MSYANVKRPGELTIMHYNTLMLYIQHKGFCRRKRSADLLYTMVQSGNSSVRHSGDIREITDRTE